MKAADRLLDEEGVFFIAEAGVNHNGELSRAKRLVDAATDAGADAVKFQTYDTDRLVAKDTPAATYQNEQLESATSQRAVIERYELSDRDHKELFEYCQESGISFLSTPFDEHSAQFLVDLGVPAIKIGSGELTNHLLLRDIAKFGRPMIVSTGMATMDEVVAANEAIRGENQSVPVCYLHCVSAYPTAVSDANLEVIRTLDDRFSDPVGFSDHTMSVEMAGLAVAAGATVIEKHLTLDRTLPGPDHKASLEPAELERAVELAREAAVARGTPEKEPVPAEAENRTVARRSLHAVEPIRRGEQISRDAVDVLRPATGLSPASLDSILGRPVTTNIESHEPITADDVSGWSDRDEPETGVRADE
ncbi:N-acetylneuraminate synthase family protein [Natrinema ejinorense]|uniref:N-acetylneuraminate synthase n=1 Tax=Natrinema ejinorense TaxID=373386 RepID=A0A2A5QQD8_9EURY|nr:N-acetylneuraminate synthase family protein [Natrinema ejinorense]PCR89009.1 N-acetylneuraminate synthase [Natrinema ejinorense]